MKRFDCLSHDEQQRYTQASAWQLRLADDPSLEVSEEFQSWLSDPANERAFEGVNTAWAAAKDFAVDPQLLDMRQAALRHARAVSTRRWSSRKWVGRAAAVMVGIMVGGTAFTYYLVTAPDVYATAIGERRTVVLSDGSQVALDSDSEVRVRYLKSARQLVLDHGRARFDVAHDITRPFSVTAGN